VNEELRRLGDEYWEYRLEVSPTTALMLGDHRYDDRHEDASREAEDEHIRRLRDFAARAEAIDADHLTADEQISREVLFFEATTAAEAEEGRLAELAVNPAIGTQAMLPVIVGQFPIETAEHADAIVTKYREMGRFLRQAADRLREGVASKRTPPDLHVDATLVQIDAYLGSPLDDDPMLNLRVPRTFDAAAAAAWKDRLKDAIADGLRPGYQAYRDVIADEVRPAARSIEEPGLCWLPDGEITYARAIHRHTSLSMDPREIHEIGLQQIAKLADEYRAIGSEALGTADLDTIFSRLRDDPELHFDNGPEIVAASEAAMAKAKAAMHQWFGRLPEADCVVAETPTGPTAFYFPPALDGSRPGTFFVNTAEPARWGRFEIEAMAYHEGIPGHHLQLAISQELTGMPEFRKHAMITSYAEGWGLYTERLADEMGLYSGPLERIGMLSADSMRAGRLVVDTGLHAMGWTRQQAIDYVASNSPMSLNSIEGEVDRYIGMPGQALAYMIGRLEIMGLRVEAQRIMGDRFDIRRFHDVVLDSGLVPMTTLGRMVREWAAA
jgi:uncharacterized protein (DUF885 family)